MKRLYALSIIPLISAVCSGCLIALATHPDAERRSLADGAHHFVMLDAAALFDPQHDQFLVRAWIR